MGQYFHEQRTHVPRHRLSNSRLVKVAGKERARGVVRALSLELGVGPLLDRWGPLDAIDFRPFKASSIRTVSC
jgi:hypothetical protein